MSVQKIHKILLAGIEPKSVAAVFPQIDSDELAKTLNVSFDEMHANPKLKTDILWLYLEDKQPADRIVEALKKDTYDAVSIGWGVRGLKENSVLFEDCVEAVRRNAPVDTKLIFSTSPEDHLDAVLRHFPDAK